MDLAVKFCDSIMCDIVLDCRLYIITVEFVFDCGILTYRDASKELKGDEQRSLYHLILLYRKRNSPKLYSFHDPFSLNSKSGRSAGLFAFV